MSSTLALGLGGAEFSAPRRIVQAASLADIIPNFRGKGVGNKEERSKEEVASEADGPPAYTKESVIAEAIGSRNPFVGFQGADIRLRPMRRI